MVSEVGNSLHSFEPSDWRSRLPKSTLQLYLFNRALLKFSAGVRSVTASTCGVLPSIQ